MAKFLPRALNISSLSLMSLLVRGYHTSIQRNQIQRRRDNIERNRSSLYRCGNMQNHRPWEATEGHKTTPPFTLDAVRATAVNLWHMWLGRHRQVALPAEAYATPSSSSLSMNFWTRPSMYSVIRVLGRSAQGGFSHIIASRDSNNNDPDTSQKAANPSTSSMFGQQACQRSKASVKLLITALKQADLS